MRLDLVYGLHVVKSFLDQRPDKILELFVLTDKEDARFASILSTAKAQGIAIHAVTKKQLATWVPDNNHQGIVARVIPSLCLQESDLYTLVQDSQKPPLLLILEAVQDPHNLGACLRTAAAVGVTAVVLTKDRSASITPAVRKVACGAAEILPIVEVVNLSRTLEQLKTLGVWLVGTCVDARESLYEIDFRIPSAIVLGNEGSGLRRLTATRCDRLMRIPMQGVIESLNISVAAGVCLYEAFRQRTVA